MTPERDDRPWGYYEVVDRSPGHCVKRIGVAAGRRLSYQRHRHRAEHWFVVSGHGVATLDGAETAVGPGSVVDVPVGAAHRIAAGRDAELVFIEVQTGDYLAEDDVERLADDFGRT